MQKFVQGSRGIIALGRALCWDIEPDHSQCKEDSPDYSKPAPVDAPK